MIPTGGTGAGRIAVSPDGKFAASTHSGSGDVALIDIATRKVAASVPLGKGPGFPLFSPDSTKLYVMNSGEGDVAVIDVAAPEGERPPQGRRQPLRRRRPRDAVENGVGSISTFCVPRTTRVAKFGAASDTPFQTACPLQRRILRAGRAGYTESGNETQPLSE